MRASIRGSTGLLLAVHTLLACSPPPDDMTDAADQPTPVAGSVTRLAYADHADAFGDLWLPSTVDGVNSVPVVVLVHGGFWRDGFFLDLMDPLAPTLTGRGVAVWNVEYRRVGAGGGHPETFDDVAAAVDHLVSVDEALDGALDLGRVATVGHSAGGHLATWLASRSNLPDGVVGADPPVVPVLAVSQAGVVDLADAAARGVGGTAVPDLLGGVDAIDELAATTSPIELVPIDADVLLVHGALDEIVPVRQSERYLEVGRAAGASVDLVVDDGAAHFEHLDPTHPVWTAVIDALEPLGR